MKQKWLCSNISNRLSRSAIPDTRQVVSGGFFTNSGQNIALAAGVISGPKSELGSRSPKPENRS